MTPRRLLAAIALAGLALSARGDSSGGDNVDRNDRTPRTAPDDAAAYQGLTKAAAIARAEDEGRPWRILREDDEHFPATMDFVPERVNFEIDDGEVTEATFG